MSGIVWLIYLVLIVVASSPAIGWCSQRPARQAGSRSSRSGTSHAPQGLGREWWWILLFLIPIVGLVIAIIVALDLAKSFGKGTGFGIGLVFLGPIFACILGFGSATYHGPVAKAA